VKQQQMTFFIRRVGILREFLPASLLEQVKKNESEWLWVEEIILELELIVDSYEQPRASPTDYQKQKNLTRGLQKRHTFKNQLIVLSWRKEIVDVVVEGARSDINI
jgi:hypothetical protein